MIANLALFSITSNRNSFFFVPLPRIRFSAARLIGNRAKFSDSPAAVSGIIPTDNIQSLSALHVWEGFCWCRKSEYLPIALTQFRFSRKNEEDNNNNSKFGCRWH